MQKQGQVFVEEKRAWSMKLQSAILHRFMTRSLEELIRDWLSNIKYKKSVIRRSYDNMLWAVYCRKRAIVVEWRVNRMLAQGGGKNNASKAKANARRLVKLCVAVQEEFFMEEAQYAAKVEEALAKGEPEPEPLPPPKKEFG